MGGHGDLYQSRASGFICPPSLWVGAGFFFVKKKDGLLQPCINYWGLNNITIKRVQVPLVPDQRARWSWSWTCVTHTTTSGSAEETSGKPHLKPRSTIFNIVSCRSDLPMQDDVSGADQRFAPRHVEQVSLCLPRWHPHFQNTFSRSGGCWAGCWRLLNSPEGYHQPLLKSSPWV